MSKQVGLTDEQKQKMERDELISLEHMRREYVAKFISNKNMTDEERVTLHALDDRVSGRDVFSAMSEKIIELQDGLNARDEEVKVLREALNEASELVEALMMDNRGKVYEQAQDFLQAKLQQFIDAHQALERTSKKEV